MPALLGCQFPSVLASPDGRDHRIDLRQLLMRRNFGAEDPIKAQRGMPEQVHGSVAIDAEHQTFNRRENGFAPALRQCEIAVATAQFHGTNEPRNFLQLGIVRPRNPAPPHE